MGGKLFTTPGPDGSPALHVPRLPTRLHDALSCICKSILQECFEHVETPASAPEKEDHGDIDMVVCAPRGPFHSTSTTPTTDTQLDNGASRGSRFSESTLPAKVSHKLGARRWSCLHEGSMSFAIPFANIYEQLRDLARKETTDKSAAAPTNSWSSLVDPITIAITTLTSPSSSSCSSCSSKSPHFHLDLTVTATPSHLRWSLFIHSYGDINSILGAAIRPLGLVLRPDGLCTRLAEIEDTAAPEGVAKPSPLLFLTHELDAALTFLALDGEKWESGFESSEEVFKWIVGCALFDRAVFEREPVGSNGHRSNPLETSETNGRPSPDKLSATEDSRSVRQKAEDSRRVYTRPMYAAFVRKWLPANPGVGNKSHHSDSSIDATHRREAVLQRALGFFEKRGVYDALIGGYRASVDEAKFWQEVKAVVKHELEEVKRREEGMVEVKLSSDNINLVVRALRRWVVFGGGGGGSGWVDGGFAGAGRAEGAGMAEDAGTSFTPLDTDGATDTTTSKPTTPPLKPQLPHLHPYLHPHIASTPNLDPRSQPRWTSAIITSAAPVAEASREEPDHDDYNEEMKTYLLRWVARNWEKVKELEKLRVERGKVGRKMRG
ncbi:MAG: hypothetical protein M1831_001249 [Alyxoria varia]|nr:MAG: hypothetical protein M1831_001249 [Alyxoria varia]